MSKINLFCIPFAGGSASIYYKWRNYLGDKINIIPIELAGRGRRINELFKETIQETVDDIYNYIKDQLYEPYILFGHSMGSILTFELINKIIKEKDNLPSKVFYSGRKPPHVPIEKHIHLLPDGEFLEELVSLGGVSNTFMENQELVDMFLPILRADFRMIENYKCKSIQVIDRDIHILYGSEEDLKMKELNSWGMYTTEKLFIKKIEGNHFFIENNLELVMKYIQEVI